MSQNDAFPINPVDEILDPGTLKQLLDLDDGAIGLIQEMCQLFEEDMPPRLDAIGAAIKAGQDQEMGDLAHAVKGAAGTMGALKVRSLALAMETLGRTGKGSESAESLLARLKTEYTRAQEALQAFIVAESGKG
jgi:two-component system aerobic respiration control sensor histidine kinase ArcB